MSELNYSTQWNAKNELWDHTSVSKISIISLRPKIINIWVRKCDMFNIFMNFVYYLCSSVKSWHNPWGWSNPFPYLLAALTLVYTRVQLVRSGYQGIHLTHARLDSQCDVLVMWNGKCDKGKGKVMAIQIAGSPWFWCCSYTDMVFPSSMLLFHPLQRKLLKTHEKCLGLGKIRGGWEECGWWCWGLSIAKVVEMSCEGAIESWWQWLGRKWKGREDDVPGNEPGGTRSLASSGEGKGLVQISKSSMSHASTPQKHIHFSILQGRTSRG